LQPVYWGEQVIQAANFHRQPINIAAVVAAQAEAIHLGRAAFPLQERTAARRAAAYLRYLIQDAVAAALEARLVRGPLLVRLAEPVVVVML
jgi:hypothetical protein